MIAFLPLLLLLAQGPRAALPAKERAELRGLLAEALAEHDPNARRSIAERARPYQERYRFEDLVAALREGPRYGADALEPRTVRGVREELARQGSATVGFTFESGGATYRYAVDLPRGYDPARPHALLVDPGHGSAQGRPDATRVEMLGMYRRHADEAGLSSWLVARTEIVEAIGAGGARGEWPDDEVAEVFQDFFRDLASRLHLDPDRIYVAGISQTGYWAWYLGRFRADRLAGILPMSAVARLPADAYLANFCTLPVYVLHGSDDPICEVAQPRATTARLSLLGAPHVYREIEGAGHDYAVWRHQPEGLKWLAARPRERYPRAVSHSLQTSRAAWCHWIRVERLAREGDGRASSPPTAGIDAEIDGQSVRLYSEGVTRLTLHLSSELLDLTRPVEVLWNGERAHSGTLARDLVTMLATAADKADWSALYEAALPLGER